MDLAPIVTTVSALGPWGIVAGIGITLLAQFLRHRLSRPSALRLPTPIAGSATAPLRLDGTFPLLNRLALALGIGSHSRSPTTADIPHEVVLQLRREVDRLSAATTAGHAAALADLERPN